MLTIINLQKKLKDDNILKKSLSESHFSPHINEIIEKKPSWLVRYGIGAMLLFLLLFLVAAWLVKYPDIIVGQVNITTPRPPVDVVAKVSVPVIRKFPFAENDTILKEEPILLLESTSSYAQIKKLLYIIKNSGPESSASNSTIWMDSLGSLQSVYNGFALASLNLENYADEQPYEKRIESLQYILAGNA